jgi:DNA repair protein RecO (recombination protein O)
MIESATGLVLRTRPLTETSLIVHWLTRDRGRVATVAKGARRPKSPFRGKIDLFYLAEFSFARSQRSELHTLREVSLQEAFSALRRDLTALRQTAYCSALIEQATETETPLTEVFELMTGWLGHAVRQAPQPHSVFVFELRLLSQLGLAPDWESAKLNPGAKEMARALVHADWEMVPRLKPSEAQIRALDHFLHYHLVFHLGKVPPGRAAALSPG